MGYSVNMNILDPLLIAAAIFLEGVDAAGPFAE